MIPVTDTIALDPKELEYSFVRATGPGGQNVNKVSSAVQLRFDVFASSTLPESVKRRLITVAGRKMTRDGVIVIEAKRFRHQARNRDDAVDRLVTLVAKAAQVNKPRHKTRPSSTSVERRLNAKKRRGGVKKLRRRPFGDD